MAFTYPTATDYTASLLQATGDLQYYADMPLGDGGILSPPMQTQVKALTSTVEATTGIGIGDLAGLASDVVALTKATSPIQIVNGIEGIVNGSLDVANMVMKATGMAADAMAVVPLVGQIAGAVFGFIKLLVKVFSQKSETLEKCRRDLAQEVDGFCRDLVKNTQRELKPTSIDPISGDVITGPGDWFRPLAKLYQAGSNRFPPTVPSMMVMLCGGAAAPFGMSEVRYQQIVALHRNPPKTPFGKPLPARNVGIPMATRLRMWALIKALMNSVQNPDTQVVKVIADNGRSVMPPLLDILNNEYWALRDGADHGIDELFVQSMASEALAWTRRDERCYIVKLKGHEDDPATYEVIHDAGCGKSSRKVTEAMVDQFEQVRYNFNFRVHNAFVDPATGLWRAGVPGGMATLREAAAVAGAAVAAERRNELIGHVVAALAGLGIGYYGGKAALQRWA